ncbi:uncharacterized protein [Antedon mediterranea]|uniref:uncharacterized protein n=1 Tax=Antedon mediterranea TaxID=105859 RepID=UPI003AF83F86
MPPELHTYHDDVEEDVQYPHFREFPRCIQASKWRQDNMAKSEISGKSFNQTLVCFSTWYDDRSLITKLKVLYQGYIADADIHNATMTMDLMKQLTNSGHLSSKNLTLLYDTIKATKQFGIVDELRVHIPVPSFSSAKEMVISKFSHHQQKVLNLGNVLIEEDVIKIDNIYNDPPKKYKDGWNLILHLQHKTIICEAKMDEFVETLKILKIPHAVDIFTKEAQLHLTLKRKRGRSNSSYQPPSSSERNLDEYQPPPGQSTNPVEILDHLNQHKGNLKFDDALEFTDKLQELVNYYSQRGVKLTLMTEGCIVFHLSVIDKYALINLREIHDSGQLLKDLAEILVAEENQQKLFQKEWITHIDQLEYHNGLCMLIKKGKHVLS